MKISPIMTPRAPSEVLQQSGKARDHLCHKETFGGLENIQEKDEFINIKLFLKNEPNKKIDANRHTSYLDSQNSPFASVD